MEVAVINLEERFIHLLLNGFSVTALRWCLATCNEYMYSLWRLSSVAQDGWAHSYILVEFLWHFPIEQCDSKWKCNSTHLTLFLRFNTQTKQYIYQKIRARIPGQCCSSCVLWLSALMCCVYVYVMCLLPCRSTWFIARDVRYIHSPAGDQLERIPRCCWRTHLWNVKVATWATERRLNHGDFDRSE